MRELANELVNVVAEAEKGLRALKDEDAARPVLEGGWSRKQVIGHLIDSASNNHQRFVRAALDGSVEFPSYDQNGWVRVGASQQAPWTLLLDAWSAVNRLLANVLAHLPAEAAQASCRIGDHEPMPLAAVVRDYIAHMHHHLDQIR